MQIACPACAASYQVPDALIGEGRQMRCVRCGQDWFATPPVAMAAVAPVVAPPPPPAPVAPMVSVQPPPAREGPPVIATPVRVRRGGGLALGLAWLGSLGLWGCGLYALWVMREQLSALWPPLVRLYALLGQA